MGVSSKAESSREPEAQTDVKRGKFWQLIACGSAGFWGSIPPSIVDASKRQGTKHTQELKGEVSESTTSGSVTKRRRYWNKLPKDKHGTIEAHDHCRLQVLMWFENHHWEHLESKYLNNDKRGVGVVKEELNLILFKAMNGDKFAEDQQKPNYKDWIENQVTEAIYNSTVAYVQMYGAGPRSSDETGIGKPEL